MNTYISAAKWLGTLEASGTALPTCSHVWTTVEFGPYNTLGEKPATAWTCFKCLRKWDQTIAPHIGVVEQTDRRQVTYPTEPSKRFAL